MQFPRPRLAVRAALAAVALASIATANAAAITDWNFAVTTALANGNSPAPTSDATGGASLQIVGMGFDGGTALGDLYSPGGAPGNGNTWRVRGAGGTDANGWISTAPQYTQGFQANVSTAGESNVTVSFNMAASKNGIGNAELEYTLDGTTWVQADAVTLSASYTTQMFTIAAAANDPNFAVRLVSAYAPGTSAYAAPAGGSYVDGGGNWRISDFQVDGTLTATPLPDSWPLLLSGMMGLGLIAVRRSRGTVIWRPTA